MNKLTIKQKEESKGKVMTGANTEVLLNGKPLPGLTGIKFEVKAASIAKVTLEMIAEVDIQGDFVIGQFQKVFKKDLEEKDERKES